MGEHVLEYILGRSGQRALVVWKDDGSLVVKFETKDGVTKPSDIRMMNALKEFLKEMR